MIGHPVKRAWYERTGHRPGRPVLDARVRALAGRVAHGVEPVDLGGSDSLNIGLGDAVLRVHKPYVSRRQVDGNQRLRRQLAAAGVVVAAPQGVFPCGPAWAELEEFVPHIGPNSGAALFTAIGSLHRTLAAVDVAPPRPIVSTCAAPRTLSRWLAINHGIGHPCVSGPGVADELRELIRLLHKRRAPAARLPNQLVHGDAHPGNIVRNRAGTPVYLDLEGVCRAPRVHDLAYALAHAVFACPRPDAFGWDELPGWLAGYDDAAGSALSAAEHDALIPYAAAVALYYDICDWGDGPYRHVARWLLR